MTSSSEKINYNLRPAKSIERKMLVELFQRLRPFGAIDHYRYIGFGSFYFNDFGYFHKALGIKNMVSIERDIDNEERFIFNRPYSCIKIEFGESNDVLPQLSWDTKSIIWLDYDSQLNQNVLSDINFICANAVPGSFILVSVNVHPESHEPSLDSPEDLHDYRYQKFLERVGEINIPLGITGKDLSGWDLSKVCQQIINNKIDEAISDRNGPREEESKLEFKQLIHFQYQDGAKMLTYGGMVIEKSQNAIFSSCDFSNLAFVRTKGQVPYKIDIPNLTFKEIRHLNSQLPLKGKEKLKGSAIPEVDLMHYKDVYRYFPAFREAEI